MSVKTVPQMRLLSEFSDRQYAHRVVAPVKSEYDYDFCPSALYSSTKFNIRHALNIANIKDFKILDHPNGFEVLLKSPADLADFNVAMAPDDDFSISKLWEIDSPKLKTLRQMRNHFRAVAKRSGVDHLCHFDIEPGNGLTVTTSGKEAYFRFYEALGNTLPQSEL